MATYVNFDQKDDGSGYIARVVDVDTKAETRRFDIPITEGRSRKELEAAVEKRLNPPPVEPEPKPATPTAAELARRAYAADLRLVRRYQEAARLGVDVSGLTEYNDALGRVKANFIPAYVELF